MYEGPVQNLIDEFGKLPGIGPKSAQRLAFHLLQTETAGIERLMSALQAIRDGVNYCRICGTVSAEECCRLCSDPRRDRTVVCVVGEPKDIEAIERSREFRGLYHVLGGALDPINGVGPGELNISGLLRRVAEQVDGQDIAEIIIATNPNTTGEATATYLARLLRDFPGLTVSRLASGLPMGADLEFADELTIGSALSGRRILSGAPTVPVASPTTSPAHTAVERDRTGVLRPEEIDRAEPMPEPEFEPRPEPEFEPRPEPGYHYREQPDLAWSAAAGGSQSLST